MASRPAEVGSPVSVPVKGMHCASCAGRIEKAIKAVPCVASVSVNLATERADVAFSSTPDLDAVIDAINKVGYAAVLSTAQFSLSKLDTPERAAEAQGVFSRVSGVVGAHVDTAGAATVRFVSGATDPDSLAKAAAAAGFHAKELKDGEHGHMHGHVHDHGDEGPALTRATILAVVLTLPVFLLEMATHLFPSVHMFIMENVGTQATRIAEFALTALVLFGPGWRFFKTGVPALLRGAPEMNSLVALGAGAAFVYSTLATFAPGLSRPGRIRSISNPQRSSPR